MGDDRPEVTVSDPTRPAGPADLLAESPEPPRFSPRLRRIALALAATALAGGVVARVAQSTAADRPPPPGLSDLSDLRLTTQLVSERSDPASLTTTVAVVDPSLPGLSVSGATVGGGWSLSSDLAPSPGRLATIELSRPAACRGVPQPELSIVLAAGTEHRSVRLALPSVQTAYLLSERGGCNQGVRRALAGSSLVGRPVDGHLEADLLLVNSSDRVLTVSGLSVSGLSVQVRTPLPVLLPRRPGGLLHGPATRVHLVLRLTQCAGLGQVLSGSVVYADGVQLVVNGGGVTLPFDRLRQLTGRLVVAQCREG